MGDLLKKTEKNEKNIFQSYIDKNKVLLPLVLLSLFLFISIFCKYFIFVAIFSILIYIVFYKINGLYYILFCIPLINIFSYDNIKFNQLAIVVSFYLAIVGIIFILDLIKKNKKINYTSTSLLIAILIIYFSQLRKSNVTNSLGIISGLFIVYFVSNYSEKLSFKKLILCYIFGVIFSVFLGLFREISPRLSSLTVISYAYSSKRFCGVSNPNVLAGHLMIALGLLYYLVLEKKIKYLFYPIYFTLFTTLLFTISKSGLINFCCISLLFLICYLVKNFKLKNIIKVVVTIILSVIIFLSMHSVTKNYINRFLSVFNKNSEIEQSLNKSENYDDIEKDDSYDHSGNVSISDQEKITQVLDDFTTGRFSLWKNYLIKTFKTVKTALFGYGINAPFTEETLGGLITNPHNTFVQILYYNGLITAVLLILFIAFCIKPKKLDRRYIYILIPILGLALYLCGDIMYSYSLFAIISIFVLCLRNENDVLNEIIISRESVGIEKKDLKIAILTPAYNRAELLKRTYKSLTEQTNKNFVWYIVDDGSSDNTEQVVKDFIKENKKKKQFEIIYIKKVNGGKHTALNVGIKQIREDYITILDSDDYFTKDAIETILQDIQLIDDKNEICGIGYFRVKENGEVIGVKYTQEGIVDTFINQRYNNNTYGDKAEVYKTEILKRFPFPEFENEKFVSESVVWCAMSGKYKMVFFNKGIYVCDYQEGGLSDGVHKRLFKNPKGGSACYKQMSTKDFCFKIRAKYTIAYIVYSLEAGMSLKEMKENHPQNKFLISLLYIPAKIYHKKLKRRYE